MNNVAFSNKVVLITGANAGIGETAAVMFQKAGATVFGVARRKEALEAARAKHPQIKWLLADVAKPAEIRGAIETAVKEAGRLDVLVNNAAVFHFAPLEAANDDLVRAQFETNVLGLSYASQAALPALKASKGSILNISSAAGHKPVPNGSHYGATKAAVEALTKSWALELAAAGVRVNAIAPGPTETPGFGKIGPTPEIQAAVKGEFVKQVPLGRMASTEEVARWILLLSDPNVTWMTGEILAIDGGMSLS